MSSNGFNGPLVLAILDGWGINKSKKGNAILAAKTPNFNNFKKNYPNSQLIASGKKVGLPDNQRGNSEAGHLNLGAGRVVAQDSVIITQTIKSGLFFKNPAFLRGCKVPWERPAKRPNLPTGIKGMKGIKSKLFCWF